MLPKGQLLVVIPTLGESDYLTDALDSVARNARDCHCVVVGPEGARAQLERLLIDVEHLPERRRGLYPSINQAALASSSWEWMTYLNDDDLLLPGFQRSLEAIEDARADVIYGRVGYLSANGKEYVRMPIEPVPERLRALMESGISPMTQQGTLVRRRCFESLGGFDEDLQLVSDFDFWIRAVLSGKRFVHVSSDVAGFRVRSDQLSSDRVGVASEMTEILDRHFPSRRHWTVSSICFRAANFFTILKRRRVFGTWRSDGLFRKKST